jgi:hypothetical protein
VARNFVAGSSQYILVGDIAALDFTSTTFTIAGNFRRASSGAEHKIAAKWSGGMPTLQYLLSINGSNVLIGAINDGSIQVATGGTAISTATDYHAALRQNGTGADSLRIFLNGVSEATSTTSGGPIDTTTPFKLGAGGDGTAHENPHDGDLWEWAAWSVALTDDEIAALGKGFSPLLIRPQSRTFYVPLVRELLDVHGASLTNGGSTVSAHGRVINAGRPWVARTPAAGGASAVPRFMHDYRRRRVA